MRALMRDTDDVASDLDVVVSETYDLGDRVVAVAHLVMRAAKSSLDRVSGRGGRRLPRRQVLRPYVSRPH